MERALLFDHFMDGARGVLASALGLLPGLLFVACGGQSDGETPNASDGSAAETGLSTSVMITTAGYGKTCSVNADCVPVVTGDVCRFCNACYTTDAISKSELARYNADVEAKKKSCAPSEGWGCGADCPRREAFCESGTCVHVDCQRSSCSRDAGSD